MKRFISMVIGLFLGTTVAGCGGGGSGNVALIRSASVGLADHLTLTLTEDTTQASVGGAVNYQTTLSNQTSAPITSTYEGQNGSVFASYPSSLNVKNSQGELVNTDGGLIFPAVVQAPVAITITLQPGQTLSSTTQYTFMQADTYTATAQLFPARGASLPTGPVTVRVR